MKSLTEYAYDNINEGLSDILKGFWKWLTGSDNKEEYNVCADEYDEIKKKKYINKYTSENIKIKKIDSKETLEEIIKNSRKNIEKSEGFKKTLEHITKNKDKYLNENNLWLSLYFKSPDLTEVMGLIVVTNNHEQFKNCAVIYHVEFLWHWYRNIINVGRIKSQLQEELKEFNKIVVTDKLFSNMLLEADLADKVEKDDNGKEIKNCCKF